MGKARMGTFCCVCCFRIHYCDSLAMSELQTAMEEEEDRCACSLLSPLSPLPPAQLTSQRDSAAVTMLSERPSSWWLCCCCFPLLCKCRLEFLLLIWSGCCCCCCRKGVGAVVTMAVLTGRLVSSSEDVDERMQAWARLQKELVHMWFRWMLWQRWKLLLLLRTPVPRSRLDGARLSWVAWVLPLTPASKPFRVLSLERRLKTRYLIQVKSEYQKEVKMLLLQNCKFPNRLPLFPLLIWLNY